MADWCGAPSMVLMAEALGFAMARRAADILERHRDVPGATAPDQAGFAADDAIFSAVLDAANECLGDVDRRPADDRWCDALLQLLQLARCAGEAGQPIG